MNAPPEVEPQDQDDAIIGQAFRWSLLGFAIIIALVAGVFLLRATVSTPERVIEKDTAQIASLDQEATRIPDIPFTDITQSAGIDFVHNNGATGAKLLPETMGGGVAIFDFDQDGASDILFVGGRSWESDENAPPSLALYRNDGSGSFTDVTHAAGLDHQLYGMGCAVGDVDNDGDPDLFVTCIGPNRFFRNDNGSFVDATAEVALGGGDLWSSSAGFFDYDRDGWLDLFVCNYVDWSPEIDAELNFTLNGTDRAYGPPTNYSGLPCYLYRNLGDGTFEEVGEAAGIHVLNPATGDPVGKSLAVILADLDRDGFDDIVVANDTVQNFLFHNQQDGRFEEIGAVAGIAYDRNGSATGAMGVDVAHPWNDESCAIGIANFANEMTSYYVSNGPSLAFADEALMNGIGSPSRARLSFGLLFFDADLDGYEEFFQANGHLEDEIAEVQPSQTYQQPAQLFWNCSRVDRSCFKIMPAERVGDLVTPVVGRGAATGDLDGDGDLDLVITQVGAAPLVLRNDQSSDNHWLRVKLTGRDSNRDALGARVVIQTKEGSQQRLVSRTRSYQSQQEGIVSFGLGAATKVDTLTIDWPSGKQTILRDIDADQLLSVTEPDESPSDSA